MHHAWASCIRLAAFVSSKHHKLFNYWLNNIELIRTPQRDVKNWPKDTLSENVNSSKLASVSYGDTKQEDGYLWPHCLSFLAHIALLLSQVKGIIKIARAWVRPEKQIKRKFITAIQKEQKQWDTITNYTLQVKRKQTRQTKQMGMCKAIVQGRDC